MQKQNIAQTQNASTITNSQTKNNGATIAIVVVVVILVLMAIAGLVGYWAYNKYIATPMKNATEGKIQIGDVSVDASKNQTWPTDLPGSIPTFNGGTIASSGKIGQTWTIAATSVSDKNFNDYKTSLQNAGWKIDANSEVDLGSLKSYTATNDKNQTVNVSMTIDDKGEKAILIAINLEQTTATPLY